MIYVVWKEEQVVEDFNRVRLEDIDLSHAWIFRVQWIFEVFFDCGSARVDNTVLVV